MQIQIRKATLINGDGVDEDALVSETTLTAKSKLPNDLSTPQPS